MSRFRFVSDHRDTYEVKRLCRLVEVSRSGFYAWAARPPSPRAVSDAELTVTIRERSTRTRRTYGAPRVHGQLGRRGICVGRKRVARLMRVDGLVGAHSKKKWRRHRPDVASALDRLNLDFHRPPSQPEMGGRHLPVPHGRKARCTSLGSGTSVIEGWADGR